MHTEWIREIAAFERVAPEWDQAVLASGEDNPFLLSDFVISWWRQFGAGRQLDIFVARQDGTIVGGVPLYHHTPGALEYPGELAANYTEILAVFSGAAVWDALLGALAQRRDWRQLRLPRVRPIGERLPVPAASHGQLLTMERVETAFILDLPEDFSTCLPSLTHELRTHIQSGLRKLEKLGPIQMVAITEPAEVDAVVPRFIEMSRAAFRGRGMASLFEDPRQRAFVTELLGRFGRRGCLDLYMLKGGEQVVAMAVGYRLSKNVNSIFMTFDPAHKKLWPGYLIRYKMAEVGAQRGGTRMDMSTGHYDYKARWSNAQQPVYLVEVLPGTLSGRIRQTKARNWRKLKLRVKRSPRLLSAARAIKRVLGRGPGTSAPAAPA